MGTVDLPVQPHLEPMPAKAQVKLPDEAGVWSYEPKWDDFRALMLAEQTPAHFIGFDALASGDRSLLGEPFRVRREALAGAVGTPQRCHLTRTTGDPELGAQWLQTFEGAGLDGVIAKQLDGPYLPGKREMVKVKHHRNDGELQMVGGAASFTVKSRWNSAADKSWIPVRPEKVCVVATRPPASCRFDQLDTPLNYDLYDVLEKR